MHDVSELPHGSALFQQVPIVVMMMIMIMTVMMMTVMMIMYL